MNNPQFNYKNKETNLDSNIPNSIRYLSPIKKNSNDDNISHESKVSNTDINLNICDNFRKITRNPNFQKLNSNDIYDNKNQNLSKISNSMINLILFLNTSSDDVVNISPLNTLTKLKNVDSVNKNQNNNFNNYQYYDNNDNNNNNQLQPKLYNNNFKLETEFNNIKNRNIIYYNDIKKQDEYISNYKNFINELNNELNKLDDQLHISLYGQQLEENLINKKENAKLINELDAISYKINQLNSIIDDQNIELKNLEITYKIIQEEINEIKNSNNNKKNNDIISNYFQELEEISKCLEENKNLYERKKKEIEQDIARIQNVVNKKVNDIKIRRKSTLEKLKLTEKENNQMNDSLFLRGSMLLSIKDFGNAKDIFKSIYLFQEKDEELYT